MKINTYPTLAFFVLLLEGKIALVPWIDPRVFSLPSGLVSDDLNDGQIELVLKSTIFKSLQIKKARKIDTEKAEETRGLFFDSLLYECVIHPNVIAKNPDSLHFVTKNCAEKLVLSEQTKSAISHPEIKSHLS